MKPKPKTRKAGVKGAIKDLVPKLDPRGGFDLASNPITDGSVVDNTRFPAAIKVPLNK
jgi:hypothetical protein